MDIEWIALAVAFAAIGNIFTNLQVRCFEARETRLINLVEDLLNMVKKLEETKEDKIDLSNATYDD